MATNYNDLVSQAYQSIGLAQGDQPGMDYWTGQLQSGALTPDNFTQNFLTAASGVTDPQYARNVAQAQNLLSNTSTYGPSNATATDISTFVNQNLDNPQAIADAAKQYGISAEDIQAATGYTIPEQTAYFNQAGISPVQQTYQDIIDEAYKSIGFTNTEDPNYQAGVDYWRSQLQSGQLSPDDLSKAFLTSASSITDPQYAEYVSNAKNLVNDYTAIMDYINANVQDPVAIYQKAIAQGVTPEQILAAQRYSVGANAPTLQAIQDYLEQGRGGYESRFQDIVSDVFGTGDQRTALESQLGGRTLSDVFKPDVYSKMSLEDIEAELGGSALNKYQSAVDTARYAANLFGADEDAQKDILTQIMSGDIKDPLVEKAYKDLLVNNTLTADTRNELLREAAKANPNAPVFQNNPELYAAFSPLGERKEGQNLAGQYGYYNNAPILSASEIDKVLNGKNLTVDFRSGRTDENAMGWDLHSRDAGRIANGVAIFGVTSDKDQAKRYADLEDSLAKLGQIKKVDDPEGGSYYVAEKMKTDSEGNQYISREAVPYEYEGYLDEKSKLDNAAKQLNIDTSKYENFDDLYNAVQDKSKDLYAVTGRTVGWDPNVAEKVGIQTLTADAGEMNHASVLYKKEGDKLLAISDPKIFTANDKTRSGFAAQVAPYAPLIAMATLPFGGVGGALTQGLGALAGTTMPAYLPAIVNAAYSTAMGGGDINDFTRSLLTQGATDLMAKEFTSGLQGLVKDGTISADIAKELGSTGAGAIATAAREGNVGDFLAGRGANYLFDQALSNLAPKLGLDTKGMTATDKVLLSTLLPAVVRGQMSEKDLINMLGKVAKAKE